MALEWLRRGIWNRFRLKQATKLERNIRFLNIFMSTFLNFNFT